MAAAMRWTQAKTLADFGQCVALWLELKLPHMPTSHYCESVSHETTRLVPVLAALNRGGKFVTECSQPGCTPMRRNFGGVQPRQRAAVMGFVPPSAINEVRSALGPLSGVDLKISPPGSPHSGPTQVSCITTQGAHIRLFGGVLSQREIAAHYGPVPGWSDHPGLHTNVIRAFWRSYQVSVVDQVWGRNSVLWPALRQLA